VLTQTISIAKGFTLKEGGNRCFVQGKKEEHEEVKRSRVLSALIVCEGKEKGKPVYGVQELTLDPAGEPETGAVRIGFS